MTIAKTDIIKNGIRLTFPSLLLSLGLMAVLPRALTPAQFNEGIPDALVIIESTGRVLVFGIPAFFSIGLSTKTQKKGLALYLTGVTLTICPTPLRIFFPTVIGALARSVLQLQPTQIGFG